MAKVFIEESTLTDIADAIRDKTGDAAKLSPAAMVTAIGGITTGSGESGDIPEENINLTGNCSYMFYNGNWDWVVERYGAQMTAKDVADASYMFKHTLLKEIPFDIELLVKPSNVYPRGISCAHIFSGGIRSLPKIVGTIGDASYLLSSCTMLRDIPDDWAESIDWSEAQSNSNHSMGNVFFDCTSLRKVPDSLLSNLYGIQTSATSVPYYSEFRWCAALDEVVGLPVHKATLTRNAFTYTFEECGHLQDMTFATQDGTPYVAEWKSQSIDMRKYIGYFGIPGQNAYMNFWGCNHGITADKEVTDDASYQALKNDPDWFTFDLAYSRYNKDSALRTIQSLPDTSAYGTNTIIFKGDSGSATDGGAINTLTEEEIAVATAKGWTVSFV